jgi:hypothetical protein
VPGRRAASDARPPTVRRRALRYPAGRRSTLATPGDARSLRSVGNLLASTPHAPRLRPRTIPIGHRRWVSGFLPHPLSAITRRWLINALRIRPVARRHAASDCPVVGQSREGRIHSRTPQRLRARIVPRRAVTGSEWRGARCGFMNRRCDPRL